MRTVYFLQLILAGIVEQDVGVSLLLDMLSAVVAADEEAGGHPYLAVVVSFARHFAEDMAGIVSRKHRTLLSKFGLTVELGQHALGLGYQPYK